MANSGDFPTKFLMKELGTVKIENTKHPSLLQDADTFFANSKWWKTRTRWTSSKPMRNWRVSEISNILGSDLQCFDRNPAEFHSCFPNFSKVFPHPQTFPGRSSRHVANGQQVSQVHLKPLDLSICSVGITPPIGYSLHGESWYTRLHGNIWKCMEIYGSIQKYIYVVLAGSCGWMN